jgi:predicted metal-binding protein
LERLVETALECGFSRTGVFDAAAVRLRQEVRDACAADKCRAYGKNWSCPPACGGLEEWEKRIRQCRTGLL